MSGTLRTTPARTDGSKPSPVNPEYEDGVPRSHHRFSIPTGDTVLQVNNALFQVHSHFLIKHSSVMSDTISLPLSDISHTSGSSPVKSRHIPLTGDTVAGWECLLGLFYPDDPCRPPTYTATQWASILILANKYVMEGIGASAIEQLQRASPALDKLDLMVLAQRIGSDDLYKQALESLAQRDSMLSLENAQKIGLIAFHDVMTTRQNYFRCSRYPQKATSYHSSDSSS